MATVSGVNLTKPAQDKLVKAAMQAAADLGYCDETKNVLEQMGVRYPDQGR